MGDCTRPKLEHELYYCIVGGKCSQYFLSHMRIRVWEVGGGVLKG